jgi:hypothetical protein
VAVGSLGWRIIGLCRGRPCLFLRGRVWGERTVVAEASGVAARRLGDGRCAPSVRGYCPCFRRRPGHCSGGVHDDGLMRLAKSPCVGGTGD